MWRGRGSASGRGAPCEEPSHTAAGIEDTSSLHELVFDHFLLGSCSANGWYDMYVDVTAHDMHNNLLFELEDTGDPCVCTRESFPTLNPPPHPNPRAPRDMLC